MSLVISHRIYWGIDFNDRVQDPDPKVSPRFLRKKNFKSRNATKPKVRLQHTHTIGMQRRNAAPTLRIIEPVRNINTPSSKPNSSFKSRNEHAAAATAALSVSPNNLNKLADIGSPIATTSAAPWGPPKHFAGTTRAMHDGLCVVICSRGESLFPVTEGEGRGG